MSARQWSAQQEAIFDWFASPDPRVPAIIVNAGAGTGKSSTIREGVDRAPEKRIGVLAFNKKIAVEMTAKLTNPNAESVTSHAAGSACVRRYWERIGVDTQGKRAIALAERVCGVAAPDPIKRLVSKLVTKAREMVPLAEHPDELTAIAIQFDCAPDDGWAKDGFGIEYVCGMSYQAMELAAAEKPVATGIDFADMLYLPIRNRWLRPLYDLVIVDEAQDFTLTQLALARGILQPGGRIAIVGDRNQAIYAFRGADSNALDRLKTELDAKEYGLRTTYRCGRLIVAEAQKLVRDYHAAPDAREGTVRTIDYVKLFDVVAVGDFLLSRTNAPLVRTALAMIRRGMRARIAGRDIGAGLSAIVRKLATGRAKDSIPAWLEKLSTWRDKEIARAEAAKLDAKIDQVSDQYDTLMALADGVSGIPELLSRLETLFADVAGVGVVMCSSVHKAKGLEADRVYLLQDTFQPPVACVGCRKRPKGCKCAKYVPDPLAAREEQNILYVGITRAIATLVYVTGGLR